MPKPAFTPTEAQRARVRALALDGLSQTHIASLIYCSAPTLRRVFAEELSQARNQRRARAATSSDRSRKRRALQAAGFERLDLWLNREVRDQLRDGLVDLGRLSEAEEDDDMAFLHSVISFAIDAITAATRSQRFRPPMTQSIPDVRQFDWESRNDEGSRDRDEAA